MSSPVLPKVSIVTPLYNNAEYLPDCIESILRQTYQNWDCTIVDNCSTDGSADIARRYAAMDARIRIQHNPTFLPALANLNAAVRLISPESKYCKVVFADDWIFAECIERMVSLAEEHPTVGIVGAYVLEGANVACVGLPYPSSILRGHEVCRLHLLKRVYVFGSANSLLYRADLVRERDPFYNESNIHADNEACFALLQECDFGFVHQVLTYTRVREGSLNAKSMQIHTSSADWLHILLSYGRSYLSPEEMEIRLREQLSIYYKILGKSLLQGRGKEFWNYHKGKMQELGVPFSRRRVALGLIRTLGDLGLNPKSTMEKLLRKFNERQAREQSPGQDDTDSQPGVSRIPRGTSDRLKKRR